MKTLQETIDRINNSGGAADSLRKHLNAVGIHDWEDITREKLYDFKDHLARVLAPNSQKTVMATLKSVAKRVQDEIDFPKGYNELLNARGNKPLKTFLTEGDLEKVAAVKPRTGKQEYVRNVFLICAYTGLRVSDAVKLTMENVVGNNLHFVAKKTKKTGAIPLKPGIEDRIRWIVENPQFACSMTYYNRIIKQICRNAGLTEDVMVFKGGKEMRGPKWKFVSSHTARISIATDLSRRGVSTEDICQLLQHSSILTTERYIVKDRITLSDEAMKFFE